MKLSSMKANQCFLGMLSIALVATVLCTLPALGAERPNIVLIMADDLGWGDVAYNGNPKVRTPVLDQWAREGVRLDRFYSGAPMCTPTRASCLTGRNAARSGVLVPSRYPLPREEVTFAKHLRDAGYATGFFGKWHLGKLTPGGEEGFSNHRPSPGHYAAPWHFGFDTAVAAEITVPTYNPEVWEIDWGADIPIAERRMVMDRPLRFGEGTVTGSPMPRWPYGFWRGEGIRYNRPLAGDTSALLAREAGEFIRSSAEAKKPFLVVLWFFTPHAPIAAGNDDRRQYSHLPIREQHAFGAVSAMDAAIGTVHAALRTHGVAENTMIWFCSDNGPSWVHELYTAGPFRGRKADLYEGGIRVPALVQWPARIKGGHILTEPVSTDDLFPTILAAAGIAPDERRPLDGENVLPLLEGAATSRRQPLFFESVVRDESAISTASPLTDIRQFAMMDGSWKLVSRDGGKSYQLYHLQRDPTEHDDLANTHRDRVQRMQAALAAWRRSCSGSLKGTDYR